jgi:hypothetical protein
MNKDEYKKRLEHYQQQFARLVEVDQAREARYQTLKVEIEALRVKYDHLHQNFLRLVALQNQPK